MIRKLRKLLKDNRGVSAVEYGLIIGLIVLAIIAALTQLATTTTAMWNHVSDTVTKA